MASPNMAKLKAMVHYIIASVLAEQLGIRPAGEYDAKNTNIVFRLYFCP